MSLLNRKPDTPLAQVRRRAAGLMCATLSVIAGAHPTARADYHPILHQLAPSPVARGEILTITGEGFGTQQRGLRVFCSSKNNGHVSPDRERMRVVSWSETTIRAQVPANLAQADSYVLYGTPAQYDVFTNTLSFTLRQASPPVDGFQIPEQHPAADEIYEQSVGTDPNVALNTRKGTGFYRVPSLRGVWYRGLLEHNGSIASLEDWFDKGRLEPDYVPTGWKGPPGTKTRAVRGHEFGLDLPAEDRKALIAFLRTL